MEGVGEEDCNISTKALESVRIHVGGLGETVTSDDLRKLFSKVGLGFESIDIVRTKGRSFAYINFTPSSPSSLSKLFNAYNGCAWRGGKLRLEKAKEHYLDKLKREWAEDTQFAAVNTDVDKKLESAQTQKPNKDLSDKKQLRIFFPRLQKLKSIPLSGTGKHKYSFRRVEIPSLPMHFCDCEEHSDPFHNAEEKQVPVIDENGGMNQEELNLMNSVMNRLFKAENVSSAPHGSVEQTMEEDYLAKASDDLEPADSDGYSTADEDNLIINVVSRKTKTEAARTSQESKVSKRKASEDTATHEVIKKHTRNRDENGTNKYASGISESKECMRTISSGTGMDSQSSVKKSASGISWSQKSSWKELVGERSDSAVSIIDKLPRVSSHKEEETKSDARWNSKKNKNRKVLQHEDQKAQLDSSELEGLTEAQPTKLDYAPTKQGRGSAWLHKVSWTQLVSSNNSSSFSIAQILPGIALEKQEPTKSDHDMIAHSRAFKNSNTAEKCQSAPMVDRTMNFEIREGTQGSNKFDIMGNNTPLVGMEDQNSSVTKKEESRIDATNETPPLVRTEDSNNNTAALAEKKSISATKGRVGGGATIRGTRPFMRTEESVKEWANIRAALSGSRKRK